MNNIFDLKVTQAVIDRINKLTADTKAQWGKMSVDQMLAHCNVTYEMVFENKHPKPSAFKRFILKTFVKALVVNEKAYRKNSQTAPEFMMVDKKNFENEKSRLIANLLKTQTLGAGHFEGLESHSFGKLTSTEWNNMFYKHLDHHLSQFGV